MKVFCASFGANYGPGNHTWGHADLKCQCYPCTTKALLGLPLLFIKVTKGLKFISRPSEKGVSGEPSFTILAKLKKNLTKPSIPKTESKTLIL